MLPRRELWRDCRHGSGGGSRRRCRCVVEGAKRRVQRATTCGAVRAGLSAPPAGLGGLPDVVDPSTAVVNPGDEHASSAYRPELVSPYGDGRAVRPYMALSVGCAFQLTKTRVVLTVHLPLFCRRRRCRRANTV
eukprot:366112-Chlamydomonas_euryale.AAC.7